MNAIREISVRCRMQGAGQPYALKWVRDFAAEADETRALANTTSIIGIARPGGPDTVATRRFVAPSHAMGRPDAAEVKIDRVSAFAMGLRWTLSALDALKVSSEAKVRVSNA